MGRFLEDWIALYNARPSSRATAAPMSRDAAFAVVQDQDDAAQGRCHDMFEDVSTSTPDPGEWRIVTDGGNYGRVVLATANEEEFVYSLPADAGTIASGRYETTDSTPPITFKKAPRPVAGHTCAYPLAPANPDSDLCGAPAIGPTIRHGWLCAVHNRALLDQDRAEREGPSRRWTWQRVAGAVAAVAAALGSVAVQAWIRGWM